MKKLLEHYKKIYKEYNISDEIIKTYIILSNKSDQDKKEFITIKLDSYIINELQNNNPQYLDIIKEKYKYIKIVLQKDKNINVSDYDKLYDITIEELSENYDNSIIMGLNILKLAKKIAKNFYNYSLVKEITKKQIIKDNVTIPIKTKSEETKKETKEENKYSLKFMKRKMNYLGLNVTTLVNLLEVSKYNIESILYGYVLVPESKLKKLYKYFNVSNYDELKLLFKNYELKNNDYSPMRNIGFIKDVSLIYMGMDKEKFAKIINCGISKVDEYLSGKKEIKDDYLLDLYYLFNTNCYEDFYKKYVELYDKKYSDEKTKKLVNYNITFLKEYYSNKELSEITGLSERTFDNYFYDKRKPGKKAILKILEAFKVETIEELKKYVKENKINFSENNDITFLKEYYSTKELSEITGLSKNSIHDYFYEKRKPSKKTILKILEAFKVETMEVLKDQVKKQPKKKKSEIKITKSLVGNEQVKKKDELNIEKETETLISQSVTKEKIKENDSKVDLRDYIDKNLLFRLMKEKVTNEEFYVIYMLFNGKDGRYYTYDEIANTLKFPKEDVIGLYKTCLDEYKRIFNILQMKLLNN